MASTIMCHFCEGHEPATLIVTVQANGETVGVGDECMPTWGLVVAGIDPALIDQVLEEAYRRQAAAETETSKAGAPVPAEDGTPAAGAEQPPAPRPRRARKPRTAEAQEDDVRGELAARPDSPATSEVVVHLTEAET